MAPFYRQLSEATLPGGFPVLGLLWLGVVLLTGWMLHYTVLGRSIYALGGSETAAVRVGFSVLKTRLFVYTFMGLLAGFASVVHTSLVQSAIPNSIVGKELDVLVEGAGDGVSIARSFRDAPEVDGVVIVQKELPTGNFARVKITNAMEYDLIADC